MKIPLLISLGRETYSNVTVQFDGTPEEAIAEGKRLVAIAMLHESYLSAKEMTEYIFNGLHGIPNSPDVWETMHPLQKQALQCYRNAKDRKKPETKIAGVDFKKNLEDLDDLTI